MGLFKISVKKDKWLIILYVAIIVLGLVNTYFDEPETVSTFAMPTNKKIIVIDAGQRRSDKPNKYEYSKQPTKTRLFENKKVLFFLIMNCESF